MSDTQKLPEESKTLEIVFETIEKEGEVRGEGIHPGDEDKEQVLYFFNQIKGLGCVYCPTVDHCKGANEDVCIGVIEPSKLPTTSTEDALTAFEDIQKLIRKFVRKFDERLSWYPDSLHATEATFAASAVDSLCRTSRHFLTETLKREEPDMLYTFIGDAYELVDRWRRYFAKREADGKIRTQQMLQNLSSTP